MPEAEIVDKDFDYGDEASWKGTSYSSKSLGFVYLQDVISDDVYDWGHSVIKENGKYKMWWVRPAVYDAIFYAESVDLKNWVNVQRVICLSPNASNVKKYDNVKGMLGKPSVIHVGDTYYMYFEAPATEDPDPTQTVLEWDNQVMLATSKDGIDWSFFGNDKGQPQPVVAMESQYMNNTNAKNYGEGQPSVFYKDGVFNLTYCHVLYEEGGRTNGIYLATSTDGKNFGDVSSHKLISSGNGLGITYNSKTKKYMRVDNSSVTESQTLDFTEKASPVSYTYCTYDTTKVQRNFAEFIKNPEGLVDTETFYIISLQGDVSTTSDWRAGYRSWDGYVYAVNPCEYQHREITLPNGGAATTENMKGYRDRSNSYTRPSGDAIYAEDFSIKIDCVKDEAYSGSTAFSVSRSVYDYGSNFTTSWAEAYVAWNETYLYLYADVYDKLIDFSYGILKDTECYMHDSFDTFVDVPNNHGNKTEVKYDLEQYIISTDTNNSTFVIKGSDEYNMTSDFSGTRHRVQQNDNGYSVEYRVAWGDIVVDQIAENKCIGLDFQLNDAMGGKVGREAMVAWSDHTGNAFRYVDGMGDVYLKKA